MSDERRRRIERLAVTGSIEDEARLLVERVRSGELSVRRVQYAASLLHEPSRIVLGLAESARGVNNAALNVLEHPPQPPAPTLEILSEWVESLEWNAVARAPTNGVDILVCWLALERTPVRDARLDARVRRMSEFIRSVGHALIDVLPLDPRATRVELERIVGVATDVEDHFAESGRSRYVMRMLAISANVALSEAELFPYNARSFVDNRRPWLPEDSRMGAAAVLMRADLESNDIASLCRDVILGLTREVLNPIHDARATRNAGRKWRSLAEEFPELIAEWSDKNLPLKPEDVRPSNKEKVWWRCLAGKGHADYDARISNRTYSESGCPQCAGKWTRSLSEEFPELIAEWSDKNLPLRPDDVTPGYEKKVWWRCLAGKGHADYDDKASNRVNWRRCPACTRKWWNRSLAEEFPELVPEWSDKNFPLMIHDITPGYNQEVWWRCMAGKGHDDYEMTSSHRIGASGCPACAGKWTVSLKDAFPDLAAEWSDKNLSLRPEDVTPGSPQKVWWRCQQHGDYQKPVMYRTRGGVSGSGCPECYRLHRQRQRLSRPDIMRKGSSRRSTRRSTRGGSSFDIGPISPGS